ncbi:hypothetical protein [Aureibacter tunicatorum]|uniref:Uncharacterized protein n=1 Tax=Aureibacter tunicatorum TaxID=866807 RepID=A0AAE3XM19_9BACT|nr:hypothetical protein [Aureibacter tunicatorum]MDR6238493.1 hypothetical protein [Aureibacter tunicatorum]BDD05574.1 hypothetical protein AUTU_30570 [Aureibacter tunicatorum]
MKRIIILFFTCLSIISYAQDHSQTEEYGSYEAPIPIELMVGNKWLMFQNIISKNFGKNDQFNYFNLVNYEVNHKRNDNEGSHGANQEASYIVQSIFSYNLTQHFSLGAGANLKAFGGFNPIIAGQYTHFSRNFGLVLQPSFEFGETRIAELFALLEWYPDIQKSWQPYFSIQGASNLATATREHEFSYMNSRLGIQYKNIRLGAAINSRFIGENFMDEWNTGAFFSILIH